MLINDQNAPSSRLHDIEYWRNIIFSPVNVKPFNENVYAWQKQEPNQLIGTGGLHVFNALEVLLLDID